MPAISSSNQLSRPTPKASIPPKVKLACEIMVHEGKLWQDAANSAGLTTRQLRLALERPATLQYLKQVREVFRDSICAGNPRRLAEIRDQDRNLSAAVRAIQVLERTAEDETQRAAVNSPGIVIVINGDAAIGNDLPVSAKPLIENGDDGMRGGNQ